MGRASFRYRIKDTFDSEITMMARQLRIEYPGAFYHVTSRGNNNNGKSYHRRTRQAEPESVPFVTPVHRLTNLCIELVSDRDQSHLWNEYIDRYHYLGYQPLPGAQIRYFAREGDRTLALLGFGAAAWKTAPRDQFIGWTREQRKRQLHLIINNARFLILPWVHSKNLASKVLAMATRRIADDWQQYYNYSPAMVETFVETPRFNGTCYRAANWIHLGETKGRGKLEKQHKARLAKKSIWVYPLVRDYRTLLCD